MGHIPGAITAVARHGKLVHFEAYGNMDAEAGKPMAPDTIFRIYSMTSPSSVSGS
jgi:CubicO group peptidase (beta-lactamase class C family)